MKKLLLQQIIDNLRAVLAEIGIDKAHMHPMCAGLVVLPYQLVELQMALDIVKNPFAKGHIALDADVCRLSFQMLRVLYTAHSLVQPFAAVAARNPDGPTHRHAQWLEHVCREVHEVNELLRRGFIVNAQTLCRV